VDGLVLSDDTIVIRLDKKLIRQTQLTEGPKGVIPSPVILAARLYPSLLHEGDI